MGWSGGSEVFEAIYPALKLLPEDKYKDGLKTVIHALCSIGDWDCECEFWDDADYPLVKECCLELWPENHYDEDVYVDAVDTSDIDEILDIGSFGDGFDD